MQQNTTEWLELRKSKIGASDAPIIMGVSPWSTPYRLWAEKLGLEQPQPMNAAMARGLAMQDEALCVFEKMSGLTMFPEVRFHPNYPFLMASLDGIDLEGKNIVEIKCPGQLAHNMAKEGKIPSHYYPQLQHQMEVCGLPSMHYFSYDGSEGVIITVDKDEEYVASLLAKEIQFWNCMQEGTSPGTDIGDFFDRDDEYWAQLAQQWRMCKKSLLALEKQEKQLRDQLIEQCNGQACRGAGIHVYKTVRGGTVDYKKIPELQNVDLTPYRKEKTLSWRIVEHG